MDNDTEKKIEHKEQKKPSIPDKGVDVSEEFQKKAHELISGASKHEVKHVHNKAYDRESELSKEEQSDYDMEGAPSSLKD